MKVQSLNLKKGFLVAFALLIIFSASATQTEGNSADNDHKILLKAISFDTSQGEPELPAELTIKEYPKEVKGYYIVQFTGSVKSTYKEELEQLGAEIYSYLPNNAFIVRMDYETKSKVEGLDFVQWIGIYQPAYKISPDISQEEVVTLTVLLFRAEDRDFVLKELESLNGKILSSANKVIRLQISKEKIKEIANLVEVEWIEEYIQPTLLNDVSRWVIQSYQSGNTSIWDHNITGAGQIVGISDSGLDYDSCYFWDSVQGAPPEDTGLPSTVTPNYNQRKVIVYHDVAGYGDYDDSQGHGTHTSGSIAGDNSANIGKYDKNDGMAYNAKLVFQDLGRDGSSAIYPPADLNDLFQQAYNDSARIHSNSWGSSSYGAYTTDSKESDEFMWNHKDFLILFANGNAGPSNNTVGSPATAKNVVSVGATLNGASAESMASFSSHGPTDDGRLKPTVGAPGSYIYSADSDNNINSYNCGYVSMSGTSMATPTTAGAAALIGQYFTDGFYPSGSKNPKDSITPSAALLKAMLINSAREMNGSYTGGTIPSNGQGWGRILLDDALYFNGDSRSLWISDKDSVSTGTSQTYQVSVTSNLPLEVTLVWTDYPSTPSAYINLVNDVDLEVTSPSGTKYLGNVFSGGESISGGSADRLNVEESVYLKTPSIGTYDIKVKGYNVPNRPQPFALVITGGLGVGRKGIVELDKDWYSCSSIVNVTLKDADLNTDNSTIEYANVTITSTTEFIPEIIKMKETGNDTAIFTGAIRTASGTPSRDGKLQISNGDLIIVTYRDADDGTGNPATVFDTANADCVAPTLTITSPINRTTYNTSMVALNYTVSEKTELVGYSLDGQNITYITGDTMLTNLSNGWHNVVVYASDLAGNIGKSSKVWFNISSPDIWIYPEAFEIILPQGNITNRTLTIGNNGTGVLEFEISGGGSGYGLILVDDGHGNTPHDAFYKDLESLGFRVDHTKSKITPSLLSSYDAFITVQASYSYSSDEIAAIQNFVSSGGGLFVIGDDNPKIYEELTGYAGISWSSYGGYSGYTTYIYKHPITENISKLYFGAPISSLKVSSPAQKVVLDSRGNTIQVAASEYGSGKVVALVDEHCLSDSYLNYADNRAFGRNVIKWISAGAGASWLSVTPQNGTISPNSQTNITVTVNATNLKENTIHNATIIINSNDLDETPLKVPVRLIVQPQNPPEIWVYPDSFNITATIGEVKYENLTIGNNGTGDLVFNISMDLQYAVTTRVKVADTTDVGDDILAEVTDSGDQTIAIDEENTDGANITGSVSLLWKYYTSYRIYSSPAIEDIDRDGKPEIVIGSDSNYVYALNGEDGSKLWSYYTGNDVSSSPALGDIDGDGKPEIVFGTEGGYVYALNGEDGSKLWSYYTSYGIYYSSPAIGDIDGDGKPEIVIGSSYYVYALNGEDGSKLWSYYTSYSVYSTPAIGDIDGDGKPEIVIGSDSNYVYALNGEDGSKLWSYYTSNDVSSSPALGDINGDGDLDVVVGSEDYYVYALNGKDGSKLWSKYTGYMYRTSPALGDIDGDGNLEIVIGSGYYVYALNGEDGSNLWSYYTSYYVYSSPAIGDIDGDGKPEIVVGSDSNYVYALNGEDGSKAWSYYTSGDVSSSPALGDLDGDGDTDVAVGSEDYYVYALDSYGTYDPSNIEWGTFHHDNMRTGLYGRISKFDWLNVTPTSGIVPPKSQTNLTVEINTTNLEVGEYNATILIKHNDILKESPLKVPVHLRVFSAPHDIAVTDITAPTSTEINSTIVINSTISNQGINDESNIVVNFSVDGVNQSSQIIPYLASGASTIVNFTWTAPIYEGVHNLTIYANPVTGENFTSNNQLSKSISVITIPDIWVDPQGFDLTLESGEIANRTLTIGNNGTGTLNASLSTSASTDLDLDNEQEIIVRDYWGYTYVVNNSNMDTYNGSEWNSIYTDGYKGFAIADVNRDSIPELLEGGNYYLRVYNVKDNTVVYNIPITGYSYGGTAAGDIDNDGIVEMLVSAYTGSIYVYDGTTGLPDAQGDFKSPTAYYGTGLGIGDIDNDGEVEVVRADYYGIDIFNGKTRALEKEIPISYIWNYPDLVFGDANGNGIAEIYVGGYYGYVYAYEWDGTTATQLWQSLDLGSYTRPCGFADADNDGNYEVFVGDSSGYLYALDPSTGSSEGSVYTGYSSYTFCAIGDIDNDGTLEIATGNYDGYIRTYTYNSGTFTLEKKSVTDYGSYLGWRTDSMIISGAKDPRVFGEASFIRFSENAVSVPPKTYHNITVTFDATKLNRGNYNATIVINSNDPDENPVEVPVQLRVITPPHITSYSPANLTTTQLENTTYTFSVTTDQVMTSNEWTVEPYKKTFTGTSSLTLTWSYTDAGMHNITYRGSNENGSVNLTWTVTVLGTEVSVYTDNTSYKVNDTQNLGLDLANPYPTPHTVKLRILLENPSGSIVYSTTNTLTAPPNFTITKPSFMSFRLPNIASGTYTWYAQLIDPATNKVISEDLAAWNFIGTKGMEISEEFLVGIKG